MTSFPVAAPLPWSARPTIPDPQEPPAGTPEDRCERCYRGNHAACPDHKALGYCCCEVDE